MTLVICRFRVRTLVTDEPTYRYDRINISSPRGDGALHLEHPPTVGDVVLLIDQNKELTGSYRVIERSWLYSSWGSANWPYTAEHSTVGPALDLIVEATDGVFRNEAPTDDDE